VPPSIASLGNLVSDTGPLSVTQIAFLVPSFASGACTYRMAACGLLCLSSPSCSSRGLRFLDVDMLECRGGARRARCLLLTGASSHGRTRATRPAAVPTSISQPTPQ
jgi:hypothetical protein